MRKPTSRRRVELAAARGVPLVATNDVRFLAATDFETHEARVCIQGGHQLNDPARPRLYTPQQFLRTPAQMCELFSDIPEGGRKFGADRAPLQSRPGPRPAAPADYPVPAGLTTEQFLESESVAGLAARLASRTAGHSLPAIASASTWSCRSSARWASPAIF